MVSITVEHLSKSFGDIQALDDVSLEIAAGEIFFLLGPSGCGKTTLIRTLAGFYKPDAGRVLFDGEDVTAVPPHKRQTAMMFQSYALWPHLSVAKNIAFGLEELKLPNAEIEERVAEMLEMVRLRGLGGRSINALSGGQQQRVALARALAVRPRCLFLDEPLSNLDAKLRLEMREEIRTLCREYGLTAVYVTHDQKEALSVADRMAILEGGCLAQVGTPPEVYRAPHSPLVAEFIGETNFIGGIVTRIEDRVAEVDTDLGHFEGIIADPAWEPKVSDLVVIAIRPESLTLRNAPIDGVNAIDGHIERSVYLGEIAQYDLKASDGSSIRLSELNPSTVRDPGKCWQHAQARREDVIILKAPPGEVETRKP